MSDFRSIRSYDWPSVLLAQASKGDFEPMRTVFGAGSSLSPEERERLPERFGLESDNRFVDTAINIATNPWILLGLATSPVASKSLKAGGRLFSGGHAKNSGDLWSRLLGPLQTPLEHVARLGADRVALEAANTIQTRKDILSTPVKEAYRSLLNNLEETL